MINKKRTNMEPLYSSPHSSDPQSSNGHNGANGNGMSLLGPPEYTVPASAAPEAASSIDYRALLGAFRRKWFLAVSIGLVAGLSVSIPAWLLIPAPFTSFSELRISSVDQTIIPVRSPELQARFDTYKQTQMRLAKSPFVLTAALRDKKVAATSLIREQDRPVDWLEESVAVSSPANEFIRISLSGERPRELADIVNAITDAYHEEIIDADRTKRTARLASLEKAHRDIMEQLKIKRTSLKQMSTSIQSANPTQANVRAKYLFELHIQMRKELAQITFELMRLDAQASINSGSPQSDIKIPDSVIDVRIMQRPEYQKMTVRIAQLEQLIIEYVRTVKENNPDLIQARSELKRRKAELAKLREKLRPDVRTLLISELTARSDLTSAQLAQNIASLQLQKKRLDEELGKVKSQEARTGLLSFEIESLDKQIAQKELMAKTLSDQIERLKIEVNKPSRLMIYRRATIPYQRDLKKRVAGTTLAGFGLFGLIVAGIVFVEYRSKRISCLNEVADGLNLRVMGALPIMPRAVTSSQPGERNSRQAFWHSVLTESIDSARTMLLREASRESINVVMIASAMGAEGKTTLACHLATSLARAGRKVLLLDCDIRRPSIHRVFDLPLSRGLCDVMSGKASLEEATHSVSPEGLSIIPAGKIDHEVLRTLALDGIRSVIDSLKSDYDFIIVDSAPILPVTDSLLIAQDVDAVMFSIRRDVSRAGKVAAACQRMAMLGIPILGAVVIGLDDGSYGISYPYRYRRYGYGYRGSYQTQPSSS